jgi:hypothetical protein
MKDKEEFELILNHLTANESSYTKFGEKFDSYKQMARLFLNRKKRGLTEEDILKDHRKGKTLEEVFSENKNRYIPGATVQKGNKRLRTWYDIMGMDAIEVDDDLFDYFFTIKLRHIDLLKIDDYLNFYLENSYKNDRQKFLRFLNVTIRKRSKELLNPEILKTIEEWIKSGETESSKDGKKRKAKIKRGATDGGTSLNLVQTGYFITLLRKTEVILKDEILLSDNAAGEVFSILTGYDAHSVRLQVNQSGQSETKYSDRIKVKEVLSKIIKLIDEDLAEIRPPKA